MSVMDFERTEMESLRPPDRQEHIAEYVFREGSVSAKELASLFKVSVMTIYRDLDELAERRIIRRERGSATAQPSSLFESDVRYRILRFKAEKEALCRRALEEIEPGQAVMLDDSTTTLPLARMLPRLAPLTVMTHFRMAMEALMGKKDVQAVCLGGEYMETHDAYVGLVCEAAISSVRPDVVVMSTSAVSGGVAFHQEAELVRVKRAMMAVARRKILLLDRSKFGRRAIHRVTSLKEYDLVLADAGAPREALRELEDHAIPHELVDTGSASRRPDPRTI
jgi:DeoR/GlpR family transcriptional regulator of sugar metabolism